MQARQAREPVPVPASPPGSGWRRATLRMHQAAHDTAAADWLSGDTGPWKTDFVQMGRKTVIRRASKYLPLSVQKAAVLDAGMDRGYVATLVDGEPQIVVEAEDITEDAEPVKKTTKLDRLEERIAPAAAPTVKKPAATVAPTASIVPDAPDGGKNWVAWYGMAADAVKACRTADEIRAWQARESKNIGGLAFATPQMGEDLQVFIDEKVAEMEG